MSDREDKQKDGSVIAAVDLDPSARAVAERACELAHCLGVEARVVHVLDEPEIVNPANEFTLADLEPEEFEEKELEAALAARRMLESSLRGVLEECAELVVLIGRPADKLVAYAREHGARTLVVGQPHAHFGSLATRLARHAPCDVHIVRTREQ